MTVDQKAQVANAREEQQMSNENDEQNSAEVDPISPTADDYVRATALAVGVDPDEAVAYRRATDRTQPEGEHHTGTLDLTGEGNAPANPIPPAAVTALATSLAWSASWDTYSEATQQTLIACALPQALAALEAAYPAIRQQVAEEIAVAIERSEDNAVRVSEREGIAGNRGTSKTWSDIATGYMRSAELAREIGGRA